METTPVANTVLVTTKSGEKKRISEGKYLAAMRNLAVAHRRRHSPMSERKRAAIMRNLAKATSAPRTPEGRARSRRNALKHGLYVRHLAGTFLRLGEDPRRFRRLGALFESVFAPRDVIEIRLVKHLTEAVWRHLRAYRAAAAWIEEGIHRRLGRAPAKVSPSLPGPGVAVGEEVDDDSNHARELMRALISVQRFLDRRSHTLHEVDRTLRLLLIHRTGDPKVRFHIAGRRFLTEIAELSADPRNWPRRYAAGVPVK
jgi:hypothetical protein